MAHPARSAGIFPTSEVCRLLGIYHCFILSDKDVGRWKNVNIKRRCGLSSHLLRIKLELKGINQMKSEVPSCDNSSECFECIEKLEKPASFSRDSDIARRRSVILMHVRFSQQNVCPFQDFVGVNSVGSMKRYV